MDRIALRPPTSRMILECRVELFRHYARIKFRKIVQTSDSQLQEQVTELFDANNSGTLVLWEPVYWQISIKMKKSCYFSWSFLDLGSARSKVLLDQKSHFTFGRFLELGKRNLESLWRNSFQLQAFCLSFSCFYIYQCNV